MVDIKEWKTQPSSWEKQEWDSGVKFIHRPGKVIWEKSYTKARNRHNRSTATRDIKEENTGRNTDLQAYQNVGRKARQYS